MIKADIEWQLTHNDMGTISESDIYKSCRVSSMDGNMTIPDCDKAFIVNTDEAFSLLPCDSKEFSIPDFSDERFIAPQDMLDDDGFSDI
jgi:hypothetical protein